ncbi:MAG: hypothetical protein ACTSYQ_04495, partial [Candidatus Odinarchaeia archaeon]
MKMTTLSQKVIKYLKRVKKPKSAIEIARGINLPLEKKRRIYDVLEILSTLNLIKTTRRGNEKLVEWVSDAYIREKEPVIDVSSSKLKDKDYCFVNVDLIFSSSDFKTLKNPTWQSMIIRDVKRQIKGVLD